MIVFKSRSYAWFLLFLTSVKSCISPAGDCGSDLCKDSRTVNIIHLTELFFSLVFFTLLFIQTCVFIFTHIFISTFTLCLLLYYSDFTLIYLNVLSLLLGIMFKL